MKKKIFIFCFSLFISSICNTEKTVELLSETLQMVESRPHIKIRESILSSFSKFIPKNPFTNQFVKKIKNFSSESIHSLTNKKQVVTEKIFSFLCKHKDLFLSLLAISTTWLIAIGLVYWQKQKRSKEIEKMVLKNIQKNIDEIKIPEKIELNTFKNQIKEDEIDQMKEKRPEENQLIKEEEEEEKNNNDDESEKLIKDTLAEATEEKNIIESLYEEIKNNRENEEKTIKTNCTHIKKNIFNKMFLLNTTQTIITDVAAFFLLKKIFEYTTTYSCPASTATLFLSAIVSSHLIIKTFKEYEKTRKNETDNNNKLQEILNQKETYEKTLNTKVTKITKSFNQKIQEKKNNITALHQKIKQANDKCIIINKIKEIHKNEGNK